MATGPGGDDLAAGLVIQVDVGETPVKGQRIQSRVRCHKRPVIPDQPQKHRAGRKQSVAHPLAHSFAFHT